MYAILRKQVFLSYVFSFFGLTVEYLVACFLFGPKSHTEIFFEAWKQGTPIILVCRDVVLPNPEWWEELNEFYPTFITWKLGCLGIKFPKYFSL